MNEKRETQFTVHCVKWNDKVNGNTYFSCKIFDNENGDILYIPFQYGYDYHYRDVSIKEMATQRWIPKSYKKEAWTYERENNYPINWDVTKGTQRQCKRHGKAA